MEKETSLNRVSNALTYHHHCKWTYLDKLRNTMDKLAEGFFTESQLARKNSREVCNDLDLDINFSRLSTDLDLILRPRPSGLP